MENQDKQVAKHRTLRTVLGVSSVLLLVLTFVRLTGALVSMVPDSIQYSVQLLLVALVIAFSILLQRSGDALRARLSARVEAAKEAEEVSVAPQVFLPSGADYERAVKQYKIVAWSAIALIASSFVLVPMIGDRIISSGAPFEVFNTMIVVAGVIVFAAAATSKYYSWRMRKAGRESVRAQEEAAS